MKYQKKKKRGKKSKRSSKQKQGNYKGSNLNSLNNAIDRFSLVNNQTFVLANQINSLNLGNAFLPLSESIQKISNQFSGFSSVLNQLQPIQLNTLQQLGQASASIHAVTGSLSNILKANNVISNNYFHNIVASVPEINNPTSSFFALSNSAHGLSKINLISESVLSQFYHGANLSRIAELTIHAEKNLSNILPSQIGSKLQLSEAQKTTLISGLNETTQSFNSIWKSYENTPTLLNNISPIIQRIPPVEVYNTTDITEKVSISDKDEAEENLLITDLWLENEETLKSLLAKIDANLYRMWQGAVQALESTNIDKIRHFNTSLRELFTHVIHKIAPDDEIKKWTSNPTEHIINGKPTRKARLLYICRNINDEHFKHFVEKDIEMMLKFIDLFQEGTHSVVSKSTEKQLTAIKCKAESAIKYLLQIHFMS